MDDQKVEETMKQLKGKRSIDVDDLLTKMQQKEAKNIKKMLKWQESTRLADHTFHEQIQKYFISIVDVQQEVNQNFEIFSQEYNSLHYKLIAKVVNIIKKHTIPSIQT